MPKAMPLPLIAAALLVASCTPPPPPSPGPAVPAFATCETLDSLLLGARIVVAPPPLGSFQPPTMDIGARPFTLASGTTASNGFAEIEDRGLAGGTGHEMEVNNLVTSISVGFGQTLQALRFSFGEYGGNLNISINNEFRNFPNFLNIDGTTIGGVQVDVLGGGAGNDRGQIAFVGTMADQAGGLGQLAVGGQELWLDDICFDR